MKTAAIAALLLIVVQQPLRQTGEIEGACVRSDTKAPIPGVQITLETSAFTAVCDASGRFSIRDVPAGAHTIRAQRMGYLPHWGGPAVFNPVLTTQIKVNANQRAQAPPLEFLPEASVEGRVLDSNGVPSVGITVELRQQGYDSYGFRRWLFVEHGRAVTDDQGRFRMSGFGPGRYYLRATRQPAVERGRIVPANSIEWQPTTYFPGVLEASQAAPILIHVGEKLVIDLNGPPARGYTISGKVTSTISTESRLSPVRLFLTRRDAGAPPEDIDQSLGTLTLSPDTEKFELHHVPPGRYELFALTQAINVASPPNGPNPYYLSRTSFDVIDHDIDTLSLTLHPGVDVKGKLTVTGDASGFHLFQSSGGGDRIVGTEVNVSLEAIDGSPVGAMRPPRIEDNTFTFENVPEGTYFLSVFMNGITRTAYVADIRSGPESIMEGRVVIGDAQPPPLEVVVNTNGATVPITVKGKTESPVLVVLVPQLPRERIAVRYRTSLVNESGQINLSYVAPGEYKLYAWSALVPVLYMDPDFIAQFGTRGVPLKITPGIPAPNIEVPVVEPVP